MAEGVFTCCLFLFSESDFLSDQGPGGPGPARARPGPHIGDPWTRIPSLSVHTHHQKQKVATLFGPPGFRRLQEKNTITGIDFVWEQVFLKNHTRGKICKSFCCLEREKNLFLGRNLHGDNQKPCVSVALISPCCAAVALVQA